MAANANLDSYDRVLMQKIRDKAIVKFDQDIYSQIYLCFLKENIKSYSLPIGKLRHHYSVLLVIGLV